MASRRNSLLSSCFHILIFLMMSFMISSCSGRFLEDQQLRHGDHINVDYNNSGSSAVPPSYFETNTVDRHDHRDLKDYLINSMARLFRFKNYMKQEDEEERTKVLNVDDFGARGNGNDDTKAFEKAWEKACSSMGRTVIVVPQKRYLVKQIKFEGPCNSNNLTIQIQGTLEASDKRSDYSEYGRHWLLFDSVENLSVEGGGTLDGNGDVWWEHSCKVHRSLPCKEAPTALTFHKCDNLRVRDLKVRNAQQMQVAFEQCKKVRASHLTVTAPGNSPNTDGIHITHTQDIEISNSDIGTGDDCISIVSGSQKVRAIDITCGPGHGISIGSLGSGNSEAHVSDVIVNRVKFSETTNGVRIKTWQGGSGSANNIKFLNIEMNNVHNPIIIDQNYCDRKNPCHEESSAVQVRHILYRNITGTSATKVAVKFDCSKTFKCEDIVLEDVDIRQHHGKDKAEASCENIELTDIGVVAPQCRNAHQGRRNDTPPPVQPPPPLPLPPVHDDNRKGGNAPKPSVQQPVFSVDDFGAQGNGKDDTEAFNKAWEKACSSKDEAFLVVPNKNYLVRTIQFGGPCKSNLTVQIHGTIEASSDRSDYGRFGRNWLLFDSVDNLVVEGGGTLNGNGDVWWKHSCKRNRTQPCSEAPTALTFHNCEKLTVRDLKIRDAQQMQVAFEGCRHVKASNININAPGNSPNTDGIHVTHTKDIEISNCVIGTGDDCISIVSGSQKVRATNITCGPGHGISIGSLGRGNSEAHVSDVIVRNAKFYKTTNGVRIKTWQGGSGNASNIKFTDIEMHQVRNPIIIDQNYCARFDRTPCKEQGSAVEVKDVLYQNIKGTSDSDVAIRFDCSKSFECEGIVLRDIELRRNKGDMAKAFCNNVVFTDVNENVSPLCPH